MKPSNAPAEAIHSAKRSLWPFSPRLVGGSLALLLFLFASQLLKSWVPAGLAWVFALPLLMVALFNLATVGIRMFGYRAYLTPHRVVVEEGIFKRTQTSLSLNRAESVDVEQTLGQRLLGYGTLVFRGTGTEVLHLKAIRRPHEFKELAFRIIDSTSSAE